MCKNAADFWCLTLFCSFFAFQRNFHFSRVGLKLSFVFVASEKNVCRKATHHAVVQKNFFQCYVVVEL